MNDHEFQVARTSALATFLIAIIAVDENVAAIFHAGANKENALKLREKIDAYYDGDFSLAMLAVLKHILAGRGVNVDAPPYCSCLNGRTCAQHDV